MIMILPLFVLAIGAVAAGYLNFPAHHIGHFLGYSPSMIDSYNVATAAYTDPAHPVNPVVFGMANDPRPEEMKHAEHTMHYVFMGISGAIAIAGIALAFLLHLKDRPKADRLALSLEPVARAIENKYWVDELYDAVIVRPLRAIGDAFFAIDRYVVDGLVWLVGFVPQLSGFVMKLSLQRGYLQGYALTMLLGIAVILLGVFVI
jgi:NADH-quinone oxidoreductase subunit L